MNNKIDYNRLVYISQLKTSDFGELVNLIELLNDISNSAVQLE